MNRTKSISLAGGLFLMSFTTAGTLDTQVQPQRIAIAIDNTGQTFKSSDYPNCIGSSGVCQEYLGTTDGAWETQQ